MNQSDMQENQHLSNHQLALYNYNHNLLAMMLLFESYKPPSASDLAFDIQQSLEGLAR